jgi:predicted AAA+ superfamily ATPase
MPIMNGIRNSNNIDFYKKYAILNLDSKLSKFYKLYYMHIYQRKIEKRIIGKLFQGKIITIMGPRQSGKTTLSKSIIEPFGDSGRYFNCELLEIRNNLIPGKPETLYEFVKHYKIIVLDEAQTVENIGFILKNFVDTYPEIQIIATGSSSFDLANKINEPMTGRTYEFTLYPLSYGELDSVNLDQALTFGMYPGIVSAEMADRRDRLQNIATNYLYKDIFNFENIRKPMVFEKLVKTLAREVGTQISTDRLAKTLDTNKATVERYIALLEQAFIIKRLYSFSRNLTSELKKAYKVYFLDIGLRNVLAEDVVSPEHRADNGHLFENFFIIERIKHMSNIGHYPSHYFWRTYDKNEVDLIELEAGNIFAFECKYTSDQFTKSLHTFNKTYPGSKIALVHKNNLDDFLGV